jgi:hypothetical protein
MCNEHIFNDDDLKRKKRDETAAISVLDGSGKVPVERSRCDGLSMTAYDNQESDCEDVVGKRVDAVV